MAAVSEGVQGLALWIIRFGVRAEEAVAKVCVGLTDASHTHTHTHLLSNLHIHQG